MPGRDEIIRSATKRILLTKHALDQMNKPDRLISEEEVESVVMSGDIIENYPTDPRGSSCLISGKTGGERYVHVVCAPKALLSGS